MTHLSLFSGIGGLDLAAEMAGFVTVGQCEIDDYATKVLEKHWPDVPRWRDIRTLTLESFYERTGLRTVDIISGGFPCQPFSIAGYRRSKEDDRYLWPEMLRVISEIKPNWVIGENVAGIVNLALDQVLADLETIGYEAQTFIVPACGVDAPHRRYRTAIVAYSESIKSDGGMLRGAKDAETDASKRLDNRGRNEIVSERQRWQDESFSIGMADGVRTTVHEADSDTDCNGLQGWFDESRLLFKECSSRERERGTYGRLRNLLELTPLGKIGPMNPNWIEWLMGFPIGWTDLNA